MIPVKTGIQHRFKNGCHVLPLSLVR